MNKYITLAIACMLVITTGTAAIGDHAQAAEPNGFGDASITESSFWDALFSGSFFSGLATENPAVAPGESLGLQWDMSATDTESQVTVSGGGVTSTQTVTTIRPDDVQLIVEVYDCPQGNRGGCPDTGTFVEAASYTVDDVASNDNLAIQQGQTYSGTVEYTVPEDASGTFSVAAYLWHNDFLNDDYDNDGDGTIDENDEAVVSDPATIAFDTGGSGEESIGTADGVVVDNRYTRMVDDGNAVRTVVRLENTGADMQDGFIVEQGLTDRDGGYFSGFVASPSDQATCDESNPGTVYHEVPPLQRGETARLEFRSELPSDEGDIYAYLISARTCGGETIGPFSETTWLDVVNPIDTGTAEPTDGGDQTPDDGDQTPDDGGDTSPSANIVACNSPQQTLNYDTNQNQIAIEVCLENTGEADSDTFIVEQGVCAEGVCEEGNYLSGVTSVSAQDLCNTSAPATVHRDVRLAAGDQRTFTLTSSLPADYSGAVKVYLASARACGGQRLAPFSEGGGSTTTGTLQIGGQATDDTGDTGGAGDGTDDATTYYLTATRAGLQCTTDQPESYQDRFTSQQVCTQFAATGSTSSDKQVYVTSGAGESLSCQAVPASQHDSGFFRTMQSCQSYVDSITATDDDVGGTPITTVLLVIFALGGMVVLIFGGAYYFANRNGSGGGGR